MDMHSKKKILLTAVSIYLVLMMVAVLLPPDIAPIDTPVVEGRSEQDDREDKYGNYIYARATLGSSVKIIADGGNIKFGITRNGVTIGYKHYLYRVYYIDVYVRGYRDGRLVYRERHREEFEGNCPGKVTRSYDIPDNLDKIKVTAKSKFVGLYWRSTKNVVKAPVIKYRTLSLNLVAP